MRYHIVNNITGAALNDVLYRSEAAAEAALIAALKTPALKYTIGWVVKAAPERKPHVPVFTDCNGYRRAETRVLRGRIG